MSFQINKKVICIVLYIFFIHKVASSCDKHSTCHECIRDSSVCAWCSSKDGKDRCKPAESSSTCPVSLENPEGLATPTLDKDFSSKTGALIQIRPQKYLIKLRPGQPVPFPFSVKIVQNYPVDLYFIFDASNSMKRIRNDTAQKAERIYNAMQTFTQDVFMGVGSFVDKNTLPYTLNVAGNLSYSFKHHLSLQKEFTRFEEAVARIPIGINRDSAEGTFDALAQVLACKSKFGWRKESRKIIVLITNALYHEAGDGKSGGIFKPYDGGCYTENGIYTKELELDYPSVSMINKLATDNNIIVIFSVPDVIKTPYSKLTDYIKGSRINIYDDSNSQNDITHQLQKIYKDITRKIKLNFNIKAPGRPKDFEISFDPDCTKTTDIESCKVTGKEDNFKNVIGTIKLLEYNEYDKTNIDITMEGIDETLKLDIEIITDCKCEKEPELNSAYCSRSGTLECGICKCNEPSYGDRCLCIRNDITRTADSNQGCMYNGTQCNKQGTCVCGVCSCLSGWVGSYCECSELACPLYNELPCGGKDRGECQCDGKCKCNAQWSGDRCNCYKAEEECTGPNQKVCNERGECNCGECDCDPIASWDSRKEQDAFCIMKPCPECHNLQCQTLTECALCLLGENQGCHCPPTNLTIVDKLPAVRNDTYWHDCLNVRVETGCYTNFTYMYDDDVYGIRLVLQRHMDCAMSYYMWGGILAITLLLVGLFTLAAWKLFTYYQDKQEYERFLKDHETDISPCENPLYEPATTTFRNPAFRKRSVH